MHKLRLHKLKLRLQSEFYSTPLFSRQGPFALPGHRSRADLRLASSRRRLQTEPGFDMTPRNGRACLSAAAGRQPGPALDRPSPARHPAPPPQRNAGAPRARLGPGARAFLLRRSSGRAPAGRPAPSARRGDRRLRLEKQERLRIPLRLQPLSRPRDAIPAGRPGRPLFHVAAPGPHVPHPARPPRQPAAAPAVSGPLRQRLLSR